MLLESLVKNCVISFLSPLKNQARLCHFEFTGWVQIQNLQHDNCKFCDLPPPSKLKNLQHDTTFICISIVEDRLFFVYLYMAGEGIERLSNITDTVKSGV